MLIKALGLIFVFLSSSAFGMAKANKLSLRAEKLRRITGGLNMLAEHIRIGGREVERLIPLCFKETEISFLCGKYSINNEYLEPVDIKLLDEFFSQLGYGDSESEYKRTIGFVKMIDKQFRDAVKLKTEQGRLYKTMGVTVGVGLCIFFL